MAKVALITIIHLIEWQTERGRFMMAKEFKFLFCSGKKAILLLVLLCIIVTSVLSSTIALIIIKTNSLDNRFIPSNIESVIDGSKVKNTGDADAFVRATVVTTWVSETDDSVYHAKSPTLGVDYALSFSGGKWVLGSDGFYYYTSSVVGGGETEPLITNCSEIKRAPDGYKLNVKIISSAIQADPSSVVEEAWGVSVRADGTLAVE